MTNISWDFDHINTKVRRNGTDWSEPETIIEDKTRSGKQKRRLYASCEKRTFNVSFIFNMVEYDWFQIWFKETIRKGMYSFNFPKIDSVDKTVTKEYRIKKGGFPKWSNESGTKMKCTMIWEEV